MHVVRLMLFSESVWLSAGEEFAAGGAVVSNDANHFVELWADLNAAGKSAI
jgi:hypothetical protein